MWSSRPFYENEVSLASQRFLGFASSQNSVLLLGSALNIFLSYCLLFCHPPPLPGPSVWTNPIFYKKTQAPDYQILGRCIGRDDWIRTSGLFVPNEARYRAALHPDSRFGLQIYCAGFKSATIRRNFCSPGGRSCSIRRLLRRPGPSRAGR